MSSEPESLMLQLLRDMRADISNLRGLMATKEDIADLRGEMSDLRGRMATKDDIADLKADMHSLRSDVAADFITLRKEVGEQIVGLRRAVIEYHTSVIGHGILISELEAPMRRVEQHLDLPPQGANLSLRVSGDGSRVDRERPLVPRPRLQSANRSM